MDNVVPAAASSQPEPQPHAHSCQPWGATLIQTPYKSSPQVTDPDATSKVGAQAFPEETPLHSPMCVILFLHSDLDMHQKKTKKQGKSGRGASCAERTKALTATLPHLRDQSPP